jgi:hypothetical protein
MLIGLFLLADSALAFTDTNCMRDCRKKGYLQGYCEKLCSYGDSGSPFQKQDEEDKRWMKTKKVDLKCLNDCQKQGNSYQYCREKCSYY